MALPKFLSQVAPLAGQAAEALNQAIPQGLQATLKLRAMGLMKIPVLFFLSPSVIEISEQRCVVKIPLTRRSRNHLHSMYFGALAAGADCAAGLMAWQLIEASGEKISLIFKDFKADFLKRAEGDVYFTCEQGSEIRDLVSKAVFTGERQNLPVRITATVPSHSGGEPVAEFVLTLSLKKKG